MNFGFTPEQDQLREQLRRFLDDRAPLAQVRQVVAAAPGFSRVLWQEAVDPVAALLQIKAVDGLQARAPQAQR